MSSNYSLLTIGNIRSVYKALQNGREAEIKTAWTLDAYDVSVLRCTIRVGDRYYIGCVSGLSWRARKAWEILLRHPAWVEMDEAGHSEYHLWLWTSGGRFVVVAEPVAAA